MADEALARLPLRSDTGFAAGASPGGGVGDDRRQSGEGRRRQPGTAPEGAASVRVVGGTGGACGCDRAAVRADGSVRGCDRAARGGVDRTRETRPRPERAGRLRPPLLHPRRAQGSKDGGEHAGSATAGPALEAVDRTRDRPGSPLLFPGERSATSTSTTSDRSRGGRHRRSPASRRRGGSTISGTPSRPSRSVPASQPSTSLATWAPA